MDIRTLGVVGFKWLSPSRHTHEDNMTCPFISYFLRFLSKEEVLTLNKYPISTFLHRQTILSKRLFNHLLIDINESKD